MLVVCAVARMPAYIYRIHSPSMEATLHCAAGPGCTSLRPDHVVVLEAIVPELKRGDIVVFTMPTVGGHACGSASKAIKRITGVPGDVVAQVQRPAGVRRARSSDSAMHTEAHARSSSFRVPPDHYFVVGDNEETSCDSRMFGPIPKKSIIGRALLVFWPLSRLRFL